MKEPIILKVNVHVVEKNGTPAIELRKTFMEKTIVKEIISAIYHQKVVCFVPFFNDPMISYAELQKKGIIQRENDGTYTFKI